MADANGNLQVLPGWPDVYELKTTDVGLGGVPSRSGTDAVSGHLNIPNSELAARDLLLRAALEAPDARPGLTVPDQQFVYSIEGALFQNQSGGAITISSPTRATLALSFTDTGFTVSGFGRSTDPVARRLPTIESGTHRMVLTGGAGSLLVEPGQSWIWRDAHRFRAEDFSPAERQFSLLGNRHYQLRWHAPGTNSATPVSSYPLGRFVLEDVTAAYDNARADLAPEFDSQFDDMLIAHVDTDGGAVPVITALLNASVWRERLQVSLVGILFANAQERRGQIDTTYAVTPHPIMEAFSFDTDPGAEDMDTHLFFTDVSRSSISYVLLRDFGTEYSARISVLIGG